MKTNLEELLERENITELEIGEDYVFVKDGKVFLKNSNYRKLINDFINTIKEKIK